MSRLVAAPTTDDDITIALAYVPLGVPLTETEARHDLARATCCRTDRELAARFGWTERDVATLRRSDWRDRDALPTVRR